MDVGSSSMKTSVFTFPNQTGIPVVSTAPIGGTQYLYTQRPGLGSLATNLSLVPNYFNATLQYLASVIPANMTARTPIFLTATAGMRALPLSQQNATMLAVQAFLSTTPYMYKPEWVSIIPGFLEGVFGWISVNYLYNRFYDGPTYGAMDLGGVSTQLTFETPQAVAKNAATVTFGTTYKYNLYAYSYQGLGNDAARDGIVQLLLNQGNTVPLTDPCYPLGYNRTVTLNGTAYLVTGSSNYASCQNLTRQLMDKSATCPTPPCSFNGVFQPQIAANQTFVLFSAFATALSVLQLPANTTLQTLQQSAVNVCNMNYTTLNSTFTDSTFSPTYCFLATFAVELPTYGYGIPIGYPNLIIQNSVNGSAISYAFGAVTYLLDPILNPRLNSSSSSSPSSSYSLSSTSMSVSLSSTISRMSSSSRSTMMSETTSARSGADHLAMSFAFVAVVLALFR
eukprot:TRINITY_DN8086_c0_g1_i1.p1 TRINITY_DN8086_c0_g1~~TRINITY_DN8086_c0_g1_i1.p1  ORF type:complete len:479 (+),score=115.06 TRINITY_DN8086_c0_g1_i1:83-1438(+)